MTKIMNTTLCLQLPQAFPNNLAQEYNNDRSTETPSSRASIHDGTLKEAVDLEAQRRTIVAESRASPQLKLVALSSWFILNLVLTISNKAVLGTASFPWLLTVIHTFATSIGCVATMGFGSVKFTRASLKENLIIVTFSVLFTLNIAVSNASLAMVSIPLHQILRSTCPLVTMLIYRIVFGRAYSATLYVSMIPLILGVGLATAGDYYCTLAGFLCTMVGVILAVVKTIASNRLMTGTLALSPMELLLRMSPLAAIQCVIYAFITGEVNAFYHLYTAGHFSGKFGVEVVVNGSVALALNFVSMWTNKIAGALSMSVAGNTKQAFTILFGIVLFDVKLGWMNTVGTTVTIAGAMLYSTLEMDSKRA